MSQAAEAEAKAKGEFLPGKKTRDRLTFLERIPGTIPHWDGRKPRHDRTMYLLSLRKPIDRLKLVKPFQKAGLKFVDAKSIVDPNRKGEYPFLDSSRSHFQEKAAMASDRKTKLPEEADFESIPLRIPVLNECKTDYFVMTASGNAVPDKSLSELAMELGDDFASFGAIYCFERGKEDRSIEKQYKHSFLKREDPRYGFSIRFCPMPRTLLVKLKEAVDEKKLAAILKPFQLRIEEGEKDGNFKSKGPAFKLLQFEGPRDENVYRLKDVLMGKIDDDASREFPKFIESVHFENMPMLNPQQGGHLWNHQRIHSDYPAKIATMTVVSVAVIDKGIQFQNPTTGGIEKYMESWNAGTSSPAPSFPITDYHGTCCAGIISDLSNTFGVASDPHKFPILSVIVPNGTDAQVERGIRYGGQHCKVISMSLNAYSGIWDHDIIVPALEEVDAINVIVCMSSGNGNLAEVPFPANYGNVISAGAVDFHNFRATSPVVPWGSNYGDRLSVVAPGVGISTTDLAGHPGLNTTDTTADFSGTSAAAPQVAAVAAMIISKGRDMDGRNEFLPLQVKNHIQRKATQVTPGGISYDANGFTPTHGHGLLNAEAALSFTNTNI